MRHNKSKNQHHDDPYERNESQASKAVTIVWSLSVVMVLVCALMAAAARVFILAQPESEKLPMLEAFALFAACVIGAVSLVLLPLMYRIRRIPPPTGLAVFGAIVATTPWIVVAVRSLQ
jgi:membrane protein YdbS with pleckstrin-like domain